MASQFSEQFFDIETYLHRTIAEDLKIPLIRILALLDINKITGCTDTKEIEIITEATLRLVDSYSLSVQLYNSQMNFVREPVALKSVIYECQDNLVNFAKLQGVKTNLNIKKSTGLAIANKKVVKSIINSLAYSMLVVASIEPKSKLNYSVSKLKNKIEVGVFSSFNQLDEAGLNKIRSNYGRVKQVLPDVVQGATAGIMIADKLCNKLDTKLNVSKHQGMTGLVFSLTASSQLALI